MRAASGSLLAGLAVLAKPVTSCMAPAGIVAGGGEGLLDLDILSLPTVLGTPLAPIEMPNEIFPTVSKCAGKLETPVGQRLFTALEAASFSIVSMFESNGVALDIFGDKETSDARRRCQPAEGDDAGAELFKLNEAAAILYANAYMASVHTPDCAETMAAQMEEVGMPMALVILEEGEPEPSIDTPWGLAKACFDEAYAFMTANDGWNADGGLGGKEYNRIPFTGDFSYTDSAGAEWNGFTPKNNPWEFKRTKSWQPLLESDGYGYITAQEHVTPHIGVTGRFFGFYSPEDEEAWGSRTIDPPSYRNRHDEVAREVLEATKLTVGDVVKEFSIPFFDNKFSSLAPLKIVWFLRRSDTLTIADFIKITAKVQFAQYNSIVLAWREKVRHDAPRPPSVVRKELGDEMVESYAGPEDGVQTMKASEWEPFIRTMPHSEYPSASSCLCEAFANTLKYWIGEDAVDPPISWPAPEFGAPESASVLSFSSWSEVSEMCGNSRVWGGLHFEEAVPAGVELCGGFEMVESIAASIDALTAGDESAAVFDEGVGELMVRPLWTGGNSKRGKH